MFLHFWTITAKDSISVSFLNPSLVHCTFPNITKACHRKPGMYYPFQDEEFDTIWFPLSHLAGVTAEAFINKKIWNHLIPWHQQWEFSYFLFCLAAVEGHLCYSPFSHFAVRANGTLWQGLHQWVNRWQLKKGCFGQLGHFHKKKKHWCSHIQHMPCVSSICALLCENWGLYFLVLYLFVLLFSKPFIDFCTTFTLDYWKLG